MRTFALLLLLAIPPALMSDVARASASTDFNKPICSRFDDAPKSVESRVVSDASAATAGTGATVATTTTPSPPVSTPTAPVKSGGTASMAHARSAPHWQTFLPGMFR